MEKKLILIMAIAIIVIALGVFAALSLNNVNKNNNTTVNNTTTEVLNVTNVTPPDDAEKSSQQSSSQSSQKSGSDPAYNSEDYVDRWDRSQKAGDSWAYTHSQPTKTGEDGHSYKRMYDPNTGESYWGYMY